MSKSKKSSISNQHKNKLGYFDPTVAGIDIGAKNIYVSIPDGVGSNTVVVYETSTPALHSLVDDLQNAHVITAVMEATGVYWIPLYEILEERGLKPVLVDAKSVKNVPGRKTDVIDCQWIQTLYSNGLLRAAFRPPKNTLTLRSYVRLRSSIAKTKQRALLHMEKALQLMNIKLSTALSAIGSISGFDIIRAIVAGERDPAKLASLRNINCKGSEKLFIDSLSGNFQKEHIYALEDALIEYDFTENRIKKLDKQIQEELEKFPTITDSPLPERDKDKGKPHKYKAKRKHQGNTYTFNVRELLWRKSGIDFTGISGISEITALQIFSELGGANVSAWKTHREFASWLKLCPGNNITGGKSRKSQRQPTTNRIAQGLRISAMGAKNSDSALGAFIRRMCGRTDKMKGIKAGAHKMAIMIYYMCKNGWEYHEEGATAYEELQKERVLKSLEKKAKKFGFKLVNAA